MHLANTSVLLGGSSQGRALAPAPKARGRGLLLAAGAAAAGAFLWAAHNRPATLGSLQQKTAARRRPKVNRLVVDALSGAVGEIASLVVLYPLDSLKVLCQARGCSAAAVLAELRAPGCNARKLRQLYAGCGSAALCSAAIGAVYLLAFYSAKRLGAAIAARGSASSAAVASPQQQQQQAGGNKAGRSGYVDGGSQLTDGSGACEGTNPLVASLAGVVASLAGSVFEAPMEMFKLRTQAGALDGPMLSVMLREASTRGLGSLYATYGAFMLKSVPYDVAELATYSQLCDWREAAAAGGGADGGSWRRRVGTAMAAMPSSASDMLIGAAAGVASVLVSMPCDTIKTRMDLLPPTCAAGKGGLLHSARAFFDTGRQLAAAGGGPGALFVGVAPRLLQTVPSTMVYWAAVEGTRRLMRKHFDVDSPSGSDSSNFCTEAAAGASAESGASAAASGLHSAIVVRSSSSSSAAAPLGVAAVV